MRAAGKLCNWEKGPLGFKAALFIQLHIQTPVSLQGWNPSPPIANEDAGLFCCSCRMPIWGSILPSPCDFLLYPHLRQLDNAKTSRSAHAVEVGVE